MYCSHNFKSKKALKEAVARGEKHTVYSPVIGEPPTNGSCTLEGPHYPEPHRWYAQVTLKEGIIVKVS